MLHPISKDLHPASVLTAETEGALLGGFDQTDDARDDFFDLLRKIDSHRHGEASGEAGLEYDPLATLEQNDKVARKRVAKA